MEFNFEWFDVQVGTPIISVASYGITFSRSAVQKMGTPEYVMLGFDKINKVIGVKICDVNEKMKIPFASKERSGNVRLNNKDFIRFVASNMEDASIFEKNAVRFTGVWNDEQKIMTVDLKRPINSDGSDEEETMETEE